ncbi:hypothetical protein ATANTOWER_020211 [Ataeniobius toweri]|uniref:Uncharacterized protein n=1 Tax=Ataeniobius toweri TaxID=208326 RepID=A0ABU7AI50_9TELE|nr:hypothetical protein [Ataeniobius toweri]
MNIYQLTKITTIKATSSIVGPRRSAQLSLASPTPNQWPIPPLSSAYHQKATVLIGLHTIFGQAELCSGEKHSRFGRSLTFLMKAALTCLLVGGAKVMSSIDCVNMFGIDP